MQTLTEPVQSSTESIPDMMASRVVAIDPGSTIGFAIAELYPTQGVWRMLHVGNTTGCRGAAAILFEAFEFVRHPVTNDPVRSSRTGVVVLEDFQFRDPRTISTPSTKTTMEIWGGVKWWSQTTKDPTGDTYMCVLQQPPATELVRAQRKVLGKNPHDPKQADHPYVAAAHVELYLNKWLPDLKRVEADPAVWR